MQTTREDYVKVYDMFGTDYTANGIVKEADGKFWAEMWTYLRSLWVDPPHELSSAWTSPRVKVMVAIAGLRECEPYRIETLDTSNAAALEESLYRLCHETVERGLGDETVPRGKYPPSFARVCKHAKHAMGIARDICPDQDDAAATHKKSKQYNLAGQNVAWCIMRNGVIETIVSRNKGYEDVLMGRPAPTELEWYKAAQKAVFVGGPVPREAHLGHGL